MENQEREAEPVAKISFGGKVVRLIRTVLVYLLAAGIVLAAVLFAVNQSPQKSLFGYRYYTVLTPSMEPAYSVGDVVVVKLSNADEIEVGDAITFNPSSDSSAYLTHRVTEKLEDYEGSGETCFRTKGDANDSEDSFLIDSSRVIGKVAFAIPVLGYVIRFVQLRWYFVVPLAVLLIVLLHLVKKYFEAGAEDDEQEENPQKPEKKPAEG